MQLAFSSLRIRILLLFAVTFVAMAGMAGLIAYIDRERDLDEAMELVQHEAEHIADTQNRIIVSTQEFLSLLVQTHDVREFSATPRCGELLAQLLAKENSLATIQIVTSNGDIVCNAVPLTRPSNIADREHFQKALVTPEIVITQAVIGRTTGKWVLPFAKAIRGDNGQVRGVMVAALDLNWVAREFSKARLSEGARLGLIDNKGIVLVRHPDPEKWTGRNVAGTAFFKTLMARGGAGVADEVGFDDVRRIFGFARFAETTAGPIYLWVGLSRDTVLADVDREFAWSAAGTIIVLFVVFGAIWIGGERMFLRPVTIMAETARKLGQGAYQARTGLRYTDDELGQLARTLDEMAVALMSKSELLKLNRALRLLSECNQALIRAENEDQLLGDICRYIVEIGNYRMAWVGFAEQDEGKTVRPAAQHGFEEGYLDTLQITWADTELGRGPTGTAIRTGAPQVNGNFSTNPLLAPWRAEAIKRGYQSSTALPLRDKSRVFGVLTIYSAAAEAFNADELKLAEELAADLAFGIVTLRTRAEKERAERATLEQFRLAEAFFNNSVNGLVMLDRKFNFVRVNEAYARACRRRIGEFAGRNHFEMYPSDTKAIFEEVVRTKQPYATFTRAFTFPDQPERGVTYWDWTLVPILDQAGEVEYLIFSLSEVTERVRLEEEKEQYLRFFRLSKDPMAIADPFGCFKRVNPAFLTLTGYDESELLSKPFLDFVLPDDREKTAAEMKLQVSARPSLNFENRYVRKNGAVMLLSWTAYFDKSDGVTYATARDITEKRQSEIALHKVNRALTALSNCNTALVHSTDETQLLNEMCRIIAGIEGYRYAWVGFVAQDPEQAITPVAQSGYESGYLEYPVRTPVDSELGRGPLGGAIRSGKLQVVQDVMHDPSYAPWRENAARLGYGSVLVAPLKSESQVFGALSIYASDANAFDEEEIRLLDELAGDLAFGINTLRTHAAHEQGAARLERSMEATIQAIATTVEMRDPYTAGHQRRVAELTVAIARELKLPEHEVHGLHLAAVVHDLGKIQIPAEILSKPSRLTPAEFELIKSHPETGYKILNDVDFPWPIAQIVYQHHERLDGSGYPRGLKGEEIVLGARIIAVADVVEAMASHRPYRAGLGIDKALQEIAANRGKGYDSAVADVCLKLFVEKRFAFSA